MKLILNPTLDCSLIANEYFNFEFLINQYIKDNLNKENLFELFIVIQKNILLNKKRILFELENECVFTHNTELESKIRLLRGFNKPLLDKKDFDYYFDTDYLHFEDFCNKYSSIESYLVIANILSFRKRGYYLKVV